ncbi:hypothetical protein [Gallaecimonas kandeliae]|uniref:hypothetical protein n=1 Tax=Gallaecimonas kandeliae TaxID=3029055 RepID=UPI0030102251
MIPGNSTVNTFDLSEVSYVKRIVVGTVDPQSIPSEEENQEKLRLINRCLSEAPKGRILGMERSFSILRIGEHQVVLEAVAYHIGFKRQPFWLIEEEQAKTQRRPEFTIDPNKVGDIIDSI